MRALLESRLGIDITDKERAASADRTSQKQDAAVQSALVQAAAARAAAVNAAEAASAAAVAAMSSVATNGITSRSDSPASLDSVELGEVAAAGKRRSTGESGNTVHRDSSSSGRASVSSLHDNSVQVASQVAVVREIQDGERLFVTGQVTGNIPAPNTAAHTH